MRARALSFRPGDLSICSIVQGELLYGARASQRVEENLQILERFLEPFFCHDVDPEAARQYGILRAQLRREGRPIGQNDMWIAAIALARDLTLVTGNLREFRRVGGLRLESW